MKLMWKEAKKYIIVFFIVCTFITITNLAFVFLSSYSIQFIYESNVINADSNFNTFLLFVGIIVITLLINCVFQFFNYFYDLKMQFGFQNIVAKKVISQYYKVPGSVSLQYDFSTNYHIIQQISTQFVMSRIMPLFNIYKSILFFVISIIFSVLINWILIVFIAIIFIISLATSIFFTKRKTKLLEEKNGYLSEEVNKLNNLLDGYPKMYFANKSYLLKVQMQTSHQNVYKSKLKYNNLNTWTSFIPDYSFQILYTGAIILSAYLFFYDIYNFSIVALSLAITFLPTFSSTGKEILENAIEYKSSKSLEEQFNLGLAKDIGQELKEKIQTIKIQSLSFKYPEATKNIFDNFNFVFEKGKKYAIVGPSGCGKSTLLSLILGNLDNYQGQIFLNDLELRSIQNESVKEQLAYLDSKNILFKTSIKNNVTLWDENFNQEKFENALQTVNLLDELKDKIYLEELDAETQLSIGQKQRLLIARLLYLDKKWLLFDESISNLDQNNANFIKEFFIKNPEFSLILITHHLKEEDENKFDNIIRL